MAPIHHFVDVITFCEKDKHEIDYQEHAGPDNSPSKAFCLAFHVHEGPGNVIGFIDRENNKYPVYKLKAYEVGMNQKIWFDDT